MYMHTMDSERTAEYLYKILQSLFNVFMWDNF